MRTAIAAAIEYSLTLKAASARPSDRASHPQRSRGPRRAGTAAQRHRTWRATAGTSDMNVTLSPPQMGPTASSATQNAAQKTSRKWRKKK